MPKCVHAGCEQTAFYGKQFNQPMFCKAHAPPGTGSVRRKCKYGECPNASFDTNDLCQRCRDVKGHVDTFAKSKFDELDRTISQEVVAAALSSQRVAAGQVHCGHSVRSEATPTNIFNKTLATGTTQNQAVATLMSSAPKKTGPKIVRVPEESKVLTDNILARKRAQTPGRSKIPPGVKGDM